jgi:hypothetical protein
MVRKERRRKNYWVYVRDPAGERLPWTETISADPAVADDAIRDLISRPYFHDEPFVLVALYRGSVYFTYEFKLDSAPYEMPQLLSRIGRIDWLSFPTVH